MADRYDETLFEGDTDLVAVKVNHGACGGPVLLSEVQSVTLTLCNEDDDTIVNSRDAQDVLNTNDGTYVDGEFSWAIQPADTTLVDNTLSEEWHIAVVRITLVDGQVRTACIYIRVIKKPC